MIGAFILILGFTPFTTTAIITTNNLPSYYLPICSTSSNYYADNSTYLSNLDLLPRMLVKNASGNNPSPFAKGSIIGAVPDDTVYGLFLCQGDVGAFDCAQCATTGFHYAQQICAFNKEVTVFYDQCLIHYSNRNFLHDGVSSLLDNDQIRMNYWESYNDNSESSPQGHTVYNVKVLMQETAKHAAYNSTWRYATGSMVVNSTSFPAFYSQAQCVPDLTPNDCWECLRNISDTAFEFDSDLNRIPRRIVSVPCNISCSTSQFYEGEPMWRIMSPLDAYAIAPVPQAFTPISKHKKAMNKSLVTALVVLLLASIFCFTLYFGFIRRHRKDNKAKMKAIKDETEVWGLEGNSSDFTIYDFSQVLEATANFSQENKLGQGGFGPVYKGQFPDGLEIAVKRLASHSGQGFTEFKNEIMLIAKLQHTNLVRLLGCSSQGEEKTLVYEYLPNKSLDFFIFDERRRALLDCTTRLAIIEGIAQGLIYLHKHSRLRVIHRDLKASNILLDSEMNPKISDFGLARIFSTNNAEENTRRIVGTYGYMAPEYASEGIFSVKSDVFSFGVLVLEIISGKRTSSFHGYGDFINLLGHAWQLRKDGLWLQLLDASLLTEDHTLEMMRRCINIALLCVQENAVDRPTMSHVVSMLSSNIMTLLPEPCHPAYFHVRVTTTEEVSTIVEPSSLNNVTISTPHGR